MAKHPRKKSNITSTHQRLLAIGAHADDLEIAIGGTLSKYQDFGYEIIYVMSTNNMSSIGQIFYDPDDQRPTALRSMELRKKEANRAANYFGTEAIHLDHPQRHYIKDSDNKLIKADYGSEAPEGINCEIPCIIRAHEDGPSRKRVKELILAHNAEAVFTHGGPMRNIEHFATQLLVTDAYWEAVEEGYEGMLLHWHDVGVNNFGEAYKKWDTFIDISKYWTAKLDSIRIHASMKPHPELMDWPNWGPVCGVQHAEIFTIVGPNRKPTQYGALTLEVISNRR